MPAQRLLLVAHGTASPAGTATIANLTLAIRAARPDVRVDLSYLDVAEPRLASAVAAGPGPTVVVPLLLTTGYHVEHDLPAAVVDRLDVSVARHLGPDTRLTAALADRLRALPGRPRSVVLAATGSSYASGADELATAAARLGRHLGRPVHVVTLEGDVRAALSAYARPGPVHVATYLLAEGRFHDKLVVAAADLGLPLTAPLATHPAVVELAWARYDAARAPR